MLLRFAYPLFLSAGVVLGYYGGPHLGAPLCEITKDSVLKGYSLEFWQAAGKWGATAYLAAVGGFAYWNFLEISELRQQHQSIYYRLRDEVRTPGNGIRDLIWAYVYAACRVGFAVGSFLGVWLYFPFVMVNDPVGQVVMLFVMLYPALWALQLSVSVVEEVFKPRELERDVKWAGLTLDVIKAHREELREVRRINREGRSTSEHEAWERRGRRHVG